MSTNFPRELHSRVSAGVEVSLWWSPTVGSTWVTVRDARADRAFVVPVRGGEQARDVFEHPYAYAARHGAATTRAASPSPERPRRTP